MRAVPDLALPGVRLQEGEDVLTIPKWGLWMMLTASVLGSLLLSRQLGLI